MKKKKRTIGFSFAWSGLIEVIKSERNFQIHLMAAFLVVAAGFILKVSTIEWLFLIIVIGFVFVTELINSAIERIIDYLRPEIHPAAKVIKDIGAGTVLVSVIIAVIIGIMVFLPKLISLT